MLFCPPCYRGSANTGWTGWALWRTRGSRVCVRQGHLRAGSGPGMSKQQETILTQHTRFPASVGTDGEHQTAPALTGTTEERKQVGGQQGATEAVD